MDDLLAALIGSTGVLIGVFAGAWRQAILQRNISQNEDLRRWQQERRESYLRFIVADDELYRGLVRDLRDPPPGRLAQDSTVLGLRGTLLPLSAEDRMEVMARFDRLWRAMREIELFHLVDDELLEATEKLARLDAELVGLVLFEFDQDPGPTASTTATVSELLKKRHDGIDDFIQKARVALNVPPGRLAKNRP
jgi:hypothetical protein